MLGASYHRVGLDPASRVDHDSVQRSNASTLAINPRNEDMAIVDPDDKRIMIFAKDKTLVQSYLQGDLHDDTTKFQSPSGLAYSTQGSLAVCDEEACTVQIFGLLGRKFERVFGEVGEEAGQLRHPCSVGWMQDEQIAVLDGIKEARVQIFTRHGALVGVCNMRNKVTRPVDMCISVTGSIQGKDLWPSWFYPEVTKEELTSYLAQTVGKAVMVCRERLNRFEFMCKKREGRIHLFRRPGGQAGGEEDTMTGNNLDWMDTFPIDFEDGIFKLILPARPNRRRRSSVRRSSAAAAALPVANLYSSSSSDLLVDSNSRQQQDSHQQQDQVLPEEETFSYQTLSEAMNELARRKGCLSPKDSRRRHLLGIVDDLGGCVQIYGYVAAQNYAKNLKTFPITSSAFFSMYRVTCKDAGGLCHPSSACFDPFGSLIILDAGNKRVVVSRLSGLILQAFPLSNQVADVDQKEEKDDEVTESFEMDSGRKIDGLNRRTSLRKVSMLGGKVNVSKAATSEQNNSSEKRRIAGGGVVVYNSSKIGGEGGDIEADHNGVEGSFSLLLGGEVYTYPGPKRTGMGKLSKFEVQNFYRVCEFLTYKDGHAMAGVCQTLFDCMITMRKEYKLWPLTPRGLVVVKQLFIDWCQLTTGEKLKLRTPQDDENLAGSNGLAVAAEQRQKVKRTLICRHWLKEGVCRFYKLVKCPTRLYAPDDAEICSHDAVMEFNYGIYCAISQMYGCRFWHQNENILRCLFEFLATEKELLIRSNRHTANLKDIQIAKIRTKVTDYPAFLRFMLIIAEHQLGLKAWAKLHLFKTKDLSLLERGVEDPYFALHDYEVEKVIGLMDCVLR